jgi:hypothetical protein
MKLKLLVQLAFQQLLFVLDLAFKVMENTFIVFLSCMRTQFLFSNRIFATLDLANFSHTNFLSSKPFHEDSSSETKKEQAPTQPATEVSIL